MDEVNEYPPRVNYGASIRKQRLVYAKDRWFRFEILVMHCFLIFLMIGWLYAAVEAIPDAGYVPIVLAVFVDSFIITNLFLLNVLAKAKGKTLLRNKEDVMNTLHHFYEGLTFMASETNVIRDIKPPGFNGFGWCITVILEDGNVYFHKATTTSRFIISPLSGLTNYLKCKKMTRYFQELQSGAYTSAD